MLSQTYYVVRSQTSGEYLVAHPSEDRALAFLLVFSQDYDALSYLNAHAPSSRGDGRVETLSGTALRPTLDRWQLTGIGIVSDPLIPQVEFFRIG
ncbi:MAG: hypothetical protein MH252_11640 [Thermosynechococcaceae cyanobacterium MS004]|nr:hypothetical protein [Thermosynechococcaceae cyanobacterium MS004]